MKILVISHEYPPIGGGGANACLHLCDELVEMGNEVTVVTAAYANLPEKEEVNGVNIVRVKAKRTDESKSSFAEMLSYLLSAYKYCDKLLKQEKYDVCQVYFGIPSGPIGVHLKRKYGLPYVVRFGGGDIPGTQKRFGVMYKILAPFIRNIWKNASALVANSVELRDMAYAFEDKYPVSIINNGVDIARFTKEKEAIEKKSECNILFVSRIIERKGLQHIIPNMRKINEATGAKLTIVGDGPYREVLEQLVSEYSATDCVEFKGKRVGDELVKEYLSGDIFILPSAWEGMPNVVLEAMAAGLPIVMTPCGGSQELIDGNGIVSDIDNFANNLIFLCGDVNRRQEMSKKSRELVAEKFAWRQKAKEYLDLYSKLIL
ncbi:MAG: glycosyltransferase family 4 protein [Lachnospiraceae bacterium]|nr:glycosyltransferase family 4 protein [Candidatus Colinaster equi]